MVCLLLWVQHSSIQWCHMSTMAIQISSILTIYSTACLGWHQWKNQSPFCWPFVRGIYWLPVDSPYNGPIMWKVFHVMTWSRGSVFCHYSKSTVVYVKFWISFRIHDDVIKWKHFPHYLPFVREFTGHQWIPRTKASDRELWCFLWYTPE